MFERLMALVLLMLFSSLIAVHGTCSSACVSCINDTCVTCDLRSYLESGSCYTCPERCLSCYNSEACYNCTEGYFGLSCEKNCISSMCVNTTCNKDSGACLHGCTEGYFLSGLSCYPCNANCKTCANYSNNCLECKEGYYGPSCQYPCSHCKDGICTRDNCMYGCGDGFLRGGQSCIPCHKNCTSCSLRFDNCHACVDGLFGAECQNECRYCSPCSQDGLCPENTLRPLASAITSISWFLSTTQSSRSTSDDSITHRTHPLISTSTNIEEWYQQKHPTDSTIIYTVTGCVCGFFVIVMVVYVVFVSKRRSRIKQTNVCLNNEELDRDGASQDYAALAIRRGDEDGHLYSGLDNTDNTVTMEITSTTCDPSGSGLETHHVLPQRYTGETEPRIYINVN